MDGLTKHLKHWEDDGWIGIANDKWFRAAAYHLRRRSAPTSFKWTPGHTRILGNKRADELAETGATKPHDDLIDTTVPGNFDLTGAKLETISQSTAYQGILTSLPHLPYNRATTINLDISRHAIHALSKSMEKDASIWTKCRNTTIRKPIQLFIFKALHNALKIGDFWAAIPNPQYTIRAFCHHQGCDNSVESLEHILLDCCSPECKTIWRLTKALWPTHIRPWPPITIGTILGCGSLKLAPTEPYDANQDKQHGPGISRLLQILISEAAHLIWALRCERVIGGNHHSTETIEKRWVQKIDHRLQLDRFIATRIRRSKLSSHIVKTTWTHVITPPPRTNTLNGQPPLRF